MIGQSIIARPRPEQCRVALCHAILGAAERGLLVLDLTDPVGTASTFLQVRVSPTIRDRWPDPAPLLHRQRDWPEASRCRRCVGRCHRRALAADTSVAIRSGSACRDGTAAVIRPRAASSFPLLAA